VSRVSVIIPTFNREPTLRQALESVVWQTHRYIEILVVNDGGRDVSDVVEVIRAKLSPERSIRLFQHREGRGVAAARNTALASASGEWIAYLDDDDLYDPDHLQIMVAALESTGFDFGYGDYVEASFSSPEEGFIELSRQQHRSDEFDAERLTLENYLRTCCVVHRKKCTDAAGGFDESLVALEDWELWFRLSRRYPFLHVLHYGCEVRHIRDQSSISGSHSRGYSWAALNCLYKLMAAMPERADLLQHYRLKTGEALEHIKMQVCTHWQTPVEQRSPLFFRQDLKTVVSRLKELQELYGIEASRFEELRGLLYVELKDLVAARETLAQACKSDPTNMSAAEFSKCINELV
jgi:glycosyltransferase involved in cell wall biosynthesis